MTAIRKQGIPSVQTVTDPQTRAALVALKDNVEQSNTQLTALAGTVSFVATPTPKLGFFGAAAVSRPTSSGNVSTVAAGATTNVFLNTTFSGGLGSTAYTVGDLVAALKMLGLIKV